MNTDFENAQYDSALWELSLIVFGIALVIASAIFIIF